MIGASRIGPRVVWAVLLGCFFASGATGLVLEVVWVRMLTQVFGSTTLAISTVLGTFMAGLGLGAWLGGKLVDRFARNPLWAYAACEFGVALSALLVPVVVVGYPGLNAWLWGALGDMPVVLALVRFVFCALLLLLPTVFMGATLPILSRAVVTSDGDLKILGRRVAALYAVNTAGAVTGAFAAGIWLLPAVGAQSAGRIAVLAAVAIGVVAALVAWAQGEQRGVSKPESATEVEPEPQRTTRRARRDGQVALVAFALSGALAMAMEVLFSRAMALVLGGAIQSFTLVLVIFLLGISAGAATMGRFATTSRDPLGWLGAALIGVAAATLLALGRLEGLPEFYFDLLHGSDAALDSPAGIGLRALVVAIVAPVTFFFGAIMPLAVRAYARSTATVGADVGFAYTCNTIGAVIGSVAGGFAMLPTFGLRGGLIGCAALALVAGVAVTTRCRSARFSWGNRIAAALLVPVAFLVARTDVSSLSWGQYQNVAADTYEGPGAGHELLYYRDGRASTVTVIRNPAKVISLLNNGKPDGSTYPSDTRMQIMLGMLPAILHERERARSLVIGYGTGITVGALSQVDSIERVDSVELEGAVYEAADRHFAPFNNNAHRDPKVDRFIGDGRNFLAARGGRYDIIVSEPPNPWVAGVANLFSHEFYRLARDHMADDGVFCQWVQLYFIRPATVKRMYRTFQATFPNVVVFRINPYESILIGSKQRLRFDTAVMAARMNAPRARRELGRAKIFSPAHIRALVALTPDELIRYVGKGPLYTDDNGRLEYEAQADYLFAVRSAANRDSLFEAWNEEFAGYGDLRTLSGTQDLE